MRKFMMAIMFSIIMIFSNINTSNANTETIVTNGYNIKIIDIDRSMKIIEITYKGITTRLLWTRNSLVKLN
jgi:hypothetical protein